MKVAVLMGGISAERDVSLVSGVSVVEGLRQAGHQVVPIDPAFGFQPLTDKKLEQIRQIDELPPSTDEIQQLSEEKIIDTVRSSGLPEFDVVFIILHGTVGEDGIIQALLDLVNIPYTGSGVLGSALAMDKYMSKRVFLGSNIPTPEFFMLNNSQNLNYDLIENEIKTKIEYPLIVKPVSQGSSVGLSFVENNDNLKQAIETGFCHDSRVLIEKYIPGREITVSILGGRVLPLAECVPEGGLYDYTHKYTDGKTQYICPADLPEDLADQIQLLGLKAFRDIGCSGFGRTDFRLSDDGKPYCLEVNTLPGMTSHSLVPKAAKAAGIDFPQLVEKICRIGIEDHKKRKIK